jgi:hypothetical protein
METGTVIVTVIAVYGAVLSTVNIIFEYLSEKGRVKVHGFIGNFISQVSDDTDYFCLFFTNIGRRPVILNKIAGRMNWYKKSDFILPSEMKGFPVSLKEGETHSVNVPLTDNFDVLEGRPWSLGVYDSYGNFHKIKRKILKEMCDQHYELKEKGELPPPVVQEQEEDNGR